MKQTNQVTSEGSADTTSKKKGGLVEFLSTLPGLLTAVAAIVTAIGGLYIGLRRDSKPENPGQNPSSLNSVMPRASDSPIELVREEHVTLTNRFAIQLVDVDTLKGKSKRKEAPSHNFNKTLGDKEHIFREVLSRAGVSGYSVKAILEMNQAQWETFLDRLDQNQRERVKQTPFARFNVYVDGNRDETYDQKAYFEGEVLTVKIGAQNLKLEIATIRNTKSIVVPESVRVKFK